MQSLKLYRIGFLVFIWGCTQTPQQKLFVAIPSSDSGIDFENRLDPSPQLNIFNYLYYYNGAGVGVADFNNDGLDDIYLVSNQHEDMVFLNEGGLHFKDITRQSGVSNAEGWSFGVSTIDVNADGWIDIYLTKVADYRNIEGKNLLYINQGTNGDSLPSFIEKGEEFGLDLKSYGTQTGFLDYDLDGDLDAFVLNHSVHPNRTYGSGSKRKEQDAHAGDRLLENQDGYYVDVSTKAGIFQGSIGYGLDFSFGDLNNDGYPDIYVGNDFFENDYLYLNNGDKTFQEVISSEENPLGHTSHFSMGNTISDLNNDGRFDIISLDMLPEKLSDFKTSGTEYPFPTYQQYLKNGYSSQFMQNTVHLNNGKTFSEVGFQMGVAATEWSWGILAADYDLDGKNDLFISNGIPGATNDLDYVSFASQEAFQELISSESIEGLKHLDKIPSKHVSNYFFRNDGVAFSDVSEDWMEDIASFSNGAAYADFDNDGDLDLIVNNINAKVFLLENRASTDSSNYIKIQLKGSGKNPNGVGSKIEICTSDLKISKENYPNQTYLSSNSTILTLGLGDNQVIDSLKVTWPSGTTQTIYDINSNQEIKLLESDATKAGNKIASKKSLVPLPSIFDFSHKENNTLDFNRDLLIPYAKSNEGPSIAVADLDRDGADDVFIGGAKGQADMIYLSSYNYSGDHELSLGFLENDINETTSSHFFDADGDNDLDLIIGYGGNEFVSGKQLQPLLLINENSRWAVKQDFKTAEIHISTIKSFDFENDGDLDVVISSNTQTGEFGKSCTNHIFLNENGNFTDYTQKIAPEFLSYGLIDDFEIADLDGNGYKDIVAAGHWEPITLFYNDGSRLKKVIIPNSNGLWNSIELFDLDIDGDLDIVAGNWGLNTKFKASKEKPLRLYRYDFDNNGKVDPIVSYYYKGEETVFNSKDELTMQLPSLKKSYLSYKSFSEASFEELFTKEIIEKADIKEVYVLESTYFENVENANFESYSLPSEAQVSTVHDILIEDFDNDQNMDLLLVGNTYELSTQIGRLDGLHGLILSKKYNQDHFGVKENLNLLGAAREVHDLNTSMGKIYIIGRNNEKPIFLKKSENNE